MSDDPKEPLSRRDFLRRAGKEAVDTGTRLVPGANLAKAAVKTPWWKNIALWRKRRSEAEKETDEPVPE